MVALHPHPLTASELLEAAAFCRERPAAAAPWLAALGGAAEGSDAGAQLAIGARDAAVAALRSAMFGARLDLSAACPTCAAPLDVEVGSDAIGSAAAAGEARSVTVGGAVYRVRPLDSTDLGAVAGLPDAALAREWLALSALVPGEGEAPPARLTEAEVAAVAEALAAVDPASDIYVRLRCYQCGTSWDAPLDIGAILAAEIEQAADLLMDEIHDVAVAYHWSEGAILALPPARRRGYLERLRG
jgi:hypothetical protein